MSYRFVRTLEESIYSDRILEELTEEGFEIPDPDKLKWIALKLQQEVMDSEFDFVALPHRMDVYSKYLEMKDQNEWRPDQKGVQNFDKRWAAVPPLTLKTARQIKQLMYDYGIEPQVVNSQQMLLRTLVARFGFEALAPPRPRGRPTKRTSTDSDASLLKDIRGAQAALQERKKSAGPQAIATFLLADQSFRKRYDFPEDLDLGSYTDRLRKRIETLLRRKKTRPVFSPLR